MDHGYNKILLEYTAEPLHILHESIICWNIFRQPREILRSAKQNISILTSECKFFLRDRTSESHKVGRDLSSKGYIN